jgi:hypothetical protein
MADRCKQRDIARIAVYHVYALGWHITCIVLWSRRRDGALRRKVNAGMMKTWTCEVLVLGKWVVASTGWSAVERASFESRGTRQDVRFV